MARGADHDLIFDSMEIDLAKPKEKGQALLSFFVHEEADRWPAQGNQYVGDAGTVIGAALGSTVAVGSRYPSSWRKFSVSFLMPVICSVMTVTQW